MGKNRDHSKFPNAITVLDNGNVGIGTSNPATLLQVAGSSTTYNTAFSIYNTSNYKQWNFTAVGSSAGSRSGNLEINNNAIDIFAINQNGYVGIGTTTPGYALTISKTLSTATTMLAIDNATNSNNNFGIDFTVLGYLPVAAIRAVYPSANNISLCFYNYNGSGDVTERFRITPNGDLGMSSKSIYAYGNIRPADNGYGSIDFYNNGFGYAYSTKFFTFKAPDLSEAYGFTNDYGSGTAAELAMVAKQSSIGNLGFYTGTSTTAKMRINVNGQITKPYQPCFSAYGPESGASTRTTGAFTSFNLTRINRGGHYNTSTGRFTAPVAGAYEFIFSLLWRQSNDSSSGEISLAINGSNVSSRGMAYTYAGAANDFHDQTFVRAIFNLSAGDYVTGWIHSSGTSTGNWYYGQQLAHFSGHLLG